MKATKIQYTVQPGFAERNKENIAKVMQELRSLNHTGLRYSAYILDDGKTFVHMAAFRDEESTSVIPNLESFKHFQAELIAGAPEIPPKFENLALVGSSYELFD